MENLLDVFKWKEVDVFSEFAKEIGEKPSITDNKNFALWNKKSPICLQSHIDVVSHSGYKYGKWDAKKKCWIDETKLGKKEDVPDVGMRRNIIWRKNGILGGDDRAGILIMLFVFNECRKKKIAPPSFLLTNGEESGCTGMRSFIDDILKKMDDGGKGLFEQVRLLLGLDRKGASEYVYYIEPEEVVKGYIESFGFTKEHGSMSDSRDLSLYLEVPSVNLSVGYYSNHSEREVVHIDETRLTANRVVQILRDPIDKRYNIIKPYNYETKRWSSENNSFYGKNSNKVISQEELQKAKRIKRVQALEEVIGGRHLYRYTYFPYLDYLLTNAAIKQQFHVVSSPDKAKTLEEWYEIFNNPMANKINIEWSTSFGKYRKIYVKSSKPRLFFLAVAIPEGYRTDCPYNASKIESYEDSARKDVTKDNHIFTKSQLVFCDKYEKKMCTGVCADDPYCCDGGREVQRVVAKEEERYCPRYYRNECSGGCDGNPVDCVDPFAWCG
jgi:hypothetical protein